MNGIALILLTAAIAKADLQSDFRNRVSAFVNGTVYRVSQN